MKRKWHWLPMVCMTVVLSCLSLTQRVEAEEVASEETQVSEEPVQTYASGIVNCGPNYEWRGIKDVENGTITIVGYNKLDMLNSGVLEIPAEIDGLTVDCISGIGDFEKRFNVFSPELVNELKLPDTVKGITDGVFSHFSNLTTCYLPNNANCSFDEPFTNWNNESCPKLETIYTTRNCSLDSLKKISFYHGVKSAGAGGKNLTTVELPSTIERFSCSDSPELSTIICPKSTKDFVISSTKNCPKLCIPVNAGTVSVIEDNYRNSGVTEITMTLDTNSPMMGNRKYAFLNCPNLKAINLTNSHQGFYSKDGVLWWNDDLFAYPAGKSYAGDFRVPENAKCVYIYAFDSCKFTSLTFSENQNVSYYWDFRDSYYEPRKNLIENTAIKKIRVVRGSEAASNEDTPQDLAKYLKIGSDQVEFYLGNQYTITYELNGGTNAEGNPTSYRAGEAPVTLKNPTKKDYVFQGWKRNDVSDRYTNTTERAYNGNFENWTFTACWTKKPPYTDVSEKDWFFEYVSKVYEEKLMTGLNDNTFGPTEILPRAQFAVILYRMNKEPDVEYEAKFADVGNNQWYTNAILWANKIGVVTGYSNSPCFGTGDPITREQMAVMMYRYANHMKYDTSIKADFSKFADAASVSGFAQDAMRWAVGNGIIKGTDNGTRINPQGSAIRAECATIINRFVELYQK